MSLQVFQLFLELLYCLLVFCEERIPQPLRLVCHLRLNEGQVPHPGTDLLLGGESVSSQVGRVELAAKLRPCADQPVAQILHLTDLAVELADILHLVSQRLVQVFTEVDLGFDLLSGMAASLQLLFELFAKPFLHLFVLLGQGEEALLVPYPDSLVEILLHLPLLKRGLGDSDPGLLLGLLVHLPLSLCADRLSPSLVLRQLLLKFDIQGLQSCLGLKHRLLLGSRVR